MVDAAEGEEGRKGIEGLKITDAQLHIMQPGGQRTIRYAARHHIKIATNDKGLIQRDAPEPFWSHQISNLCCTLQPPQSKMGVQNKKDYSIEIDAREQGPARFRAGRSRAAGQESRAHDFHWEAAQQRVSVKFPATHYGRAKTRRHVELFGDHFCLIMPARARATQINLLKRDDIGVE